MRVYLMDDDPEFRTLLRHLFEMEGCEVVGEADSARLGTPIVAGVRPDLIIMDMNMPGLRTRDAIPLIMHADPHTHIVVLTGRSEREYKAKVLKAGAFAFREKSGGLAEVVHELATTTRVRV